MGKKHDLQRYGYNKYDVYGLSKEEMEVDTDVNEDPNRERLLDEAVESYRLETFDEEIDE